MTTALLIPPRSLAVSCQARADNPLHGPVFMAAMAQAAEQGGARALRANGPADIAAIRAVSRLPIIGILKRWDDRFPVYITPDFASAAAIAAAGADIIALDATDRPRDGEPLAEAVPVPIVAEGRFEQPEQLEVAFAAGAHAVVVGTAITNPREITRRFARHAGA